MPLRKVDNIESMQSANANHLLMAAYKRTNPVEPATGNKSHFDLFVRLAPGNISAFKDQQRCWCYRGDKYTSEPHKMLMNLLKLASKRISEYDIVLLSDHTRRGNDTAILKIVHGVIEVNQLNQYSLLLQRFPLPDFLTQTSN